jgi:FG-GAP-like repeat
VRILFFFLFPFSLLAQFTYTVDQSIPVEINGKTLLNPWAGGLNAAQVNTMDLNADGTADLVIFDKTSSRISTFLAEKATYQYAPEYEILFPADVSTFVVLRDFNCDGKKDLFTFGQIGIFVYQNVTEGGKSLSWKKLKFFNANSGLKSEVLLTTGLSLNKINLLPGTNDLPDFVDMDGDGDLDVLNMKFVSPSQAEFHKNYSMELYGRCDSLELKKETSIYGGFTECSCGKIAFNNQTCDQIGGRIEQIQHTGGKALLALDMDNDGDKDLLFSEESCPTLYYMQNSGTTENALFNGFTTFPPGQPLSPNLYPAAYLEDLDFDGKADLLSSPNIYTRSGLTDNLLESLWLYKNSGTNALPNFTFVKNNFLQEDMIDVGDQSSPAFTDIDQDGDEDLFIGKYISKNSKSSISYYENTGSHGAPSFKFVTDDFLGLAVFNIRNIKPQFADLDRNGGLDLIFTATSPNGSTRLYYVLSSSTTSSLFGGQTLATLNVTLDTNENVTMVDIDLDKFPDLLIGTSTGSLEYWRNSGNGNTFTLANAAYLGLGESISRQNITAVVGDVDNDDREDLIVGDQGGKLSIYGDFRSSGASPSPVTDLIYDSFARTYGSKNLGGKLKPVIADLFGTDKPEIVVGNTLGGLHVLKNDNGLALAEVPVINIFPNPLSGNQPLSILSDRNATMEIYTILGIRIGSSLFVPANQIISYPFQGVSPGIYIARFTAGAKTLAKRFIVL